MFAYFEVKHELIFINFLRYVGCCLLQMSNVLNGADPYLYLHIAEYIKAWYQCSSELKYIDLNPSVDILFSEFCMWCILINTNLNSEVTHILFNYLLQKLSVLHWQG